MIRTIYQRLCQLLRSLLGRGGSEEGDQAEQNTEQDTNQSDAKSGRDDGAEHDDRPDDVKDDSGDDQGDDQGDDGAERDADPDVVKDDSGDDQADSSDEGQDANEDESPTHSGDEDSGIPWPPTDPVPWPDRPDDPEGTIKVRLYHADAELGLQACRQTAPHLEWALLDAWSDRFDLDVDVTVRAEPVPDKAADPETFDNWIWEGGVEMAKDANILVVDSGAGAAGGYSGHVNGPEYFDGWGFDSLTADEGEPQVVPYGDSEARVGCNRIIHETLHCLGLSHNGRFDEFELVDWYGQSYLPPLWTSYRDHSRHTIRLCAANRRVRPSVQ
jgi:hypothetical protein